MLRPNLKLEQEDWKWQMRNSYKEFSGHDEVTSRYPFFIPPFFYQHIKALGFPKSLTSQFFPKADELSGDGFDDPIGDEKYKKVDKLIHRYKNRVLLTPTTVCPIQCRYCFRKNELHGQDLFSGPLQNALDYIATNQEIDEVILTGGDPLILDNKQLKKILQRLESIEHVQWIRFHTRTPIILPMRIDQEFLSLMSEKIKIVIHINHVDEITTQFIKVAKLLANTQAELLSQSVLLKDVNDHEDELISLFKKLALLKIRPYYLHHPDKVKGGMHFYIDIRKGREIYAKLRNKLSGWMIPQYVLDIPNGFGKTPIWNPESLEFSGQVIDRFGQYKSYTQPDKNCFPTEELS